MRAYVCLFICFPGDQVCSHRSLINVPDGSVSNKCVYVVMHHHHDRFNITKGHKEPASSVLCVTRVSSPGAKHVSIGFSELALSENARLHILVRNVGDGDHVYADFVIGCRESAHHGRFNTPAFLGAFVCVAFSPSLLREGRGDWLDERKC